MNRILIQEVVEMLGQFFSNGGKKVGWPLVFPLFLCDKVQ